MSMQGSVNWMAPEVARGKGYSAKVDIWSCGCLLLEMMTGQVPWHNVRGNVIYLLGTGNTPPLPETLNDMAKDFLGATFTIDPELRPTATTLLEHVFTDIDITSVDFEKWSNDAMQLRAEMGTSSEDPTTDESLADSDSDSDSYDDSNEADAFWNTDSPLQGISTPTSHNHVCGLEEEFRTVPLITGTEFDFFDDDLESKNFIDLIELELTDSIQQLLGKNN